MLPAVPALLCRICRSASSLYVAAALMALFGVASVAGAQSCNASGSNPVTLTCTSSGTHSSPAVQTIGGSAPSPQTSTITVPNTYSSYSVTGVYVILNGVYSTDGNNDYNSMNYAAFMLSAPGNGQQLAFLGATGNGCDNSSCDGQALNGLNITVQDGGTAAPLYPNQQWQDTGSVTVKPSSYYYNPSNPGSLGSPLPSGVSSGSTHLAQTDGSGTFTNQFVGVGTTPDGNWTLTLEDNDNYFAPTIPVESDPVSVNNWTLVLTLTPNVKTNTTTSLSTNATNSTAITETTVTLTATVTYDSGESVTGGTVSFTDGANTLCGSATVSNGTATCNTSFTTEGIHSLSASYSGNSTYNGSGPAGASLYLRNLTQLTSGQYCNSGAISEDGASITPYPSVINVGTDTTNLTGTVAGVTVTLNGMSDPLGQWGTGTAFLLVAPDESKAYNLDFLSSAANNSTGTYIVSFADGNPSVGLNSAFVSGQTYEATDYNYETDPFAASVSPAPALPNETFNYAQPDYFGTAKNFAQAFGGANGKGNWLLFPYNTSGEAATINSGWCLSFEVNTGAATTTMLTSTYPGNGTSANPAALGASIKLTATVTSTSTVNSGTLSIVDNTTQTTLASGTPSNGVVSATVSNLTEGDHDIVATYSGVTNVFETSSASIYQRIDKATTVTGNGTAASPARYCNANGITLPSQYISNNIGPASPNPSNIFPTNLPGTLKSVEVEFDGFHTADPVMVDTATLLVGPNGVGYDFLSGAGNSGTEQSSGTYYFEDGQSAASQSGFGPGTYEGSAYDTTDTFFPSLSGFETLPGSFDYAEPHSDPFTFNGAIDGAFTDLNVSNNGANGTWSLYFNQNIHDTGAGMTGWCLNFVENLPTVAPVATHAGSFIQGEQDQSIYLNVTNDGNGPTGDPSNTNPMTVVDTVPSGLTITGASGSGWTCNTSGQTVTCTTHATVAQGSGYNQITITTNVATSATPGSITSSFSTSGGGANSATSPGDTFNIEPAAVLSVSKTHTGTFTQGSTAQWNITVNNTSSGGTTNGTVSVTDSLPTGYSVTSFSASGWSCSGTTSVTCTTTNTEPGGSSFPAIEMTVSVPANSATSVSNTALAWGGGDLTHTSQGTAASGTDANVPVVQVPSKITISSGNNQSAGLASSFASPLVVQVTDAAGATIQGSSVTFTAPASGASGTFTSSTTNTITVPTDVNGNASSGTFTANAVLGGPYMVSASDSPAASVTFNLTNIPGAAATLQFTGLPATAVSGTSFPFTVTAYDAYGNQATGYSGSLNLTTSDPSAPALSPVTMGGGTGTGSATLATPGNQTITATDSVNSGLTVTSGFIAVSAPYLVVNTANDDTSTPQASYCTPQSAPGTNTIDTACSLRDALLYAGNAGAGSISFDTNAFSSAQTILVGGFGTMTIPTNTTITGATSGSGYGLQNLVTVDGAGTYQIFIATGTATVNGLTIQNGNNAGGGAAIHHSGGTLTLTNCTIQNNAASTGNSGAGYGGAVQGPDPLVVNNCTFSGNSAGADGGAIYQSNNTLTITNSTFYNNSSDDAGAIYYTGASGTIANSTIAGNTAGSYGGAIENFAALTMVNNVISNNSSGAGGAILNRDDSTGTLNANYNVFYNNNNTTPAEVDISCGSGNCQSPSTVNTNFTEATANPVAALGPYGGPTLTMLPQPNAGAVCGGSRALVPNGVNNDQRGLPLDPLCVNGPVDAGAVQSNYVLSYTEQPPTVVIVGNTVGPSAVQLTESGQVATVAVGTVTVSDNQTGVLGGTLTSALASGSASFTGIVYETAITGDTLTATLPLNSSLTPIPLNAYAQPIQTISAYVPATMSSPTPGNTLPGSSVTFTWSGAPSVVAYQLWVGNLGTDSNNLYSPSAPLSAGTTTVTVNNLPVSGNTLYVRLFTEVSSGVWVSINYTYTEASQSQGVLTPSSGTLAGSSQLFQWSAGSGATGYQFWLGTGSVGSANLCSSGVLSSSSLSITCNNLPVSGVPLYARLYTQLSGAWQHTDYTFTAATLSQAVLSSPSPSPSPSSTLAGTSQLFQWSAGSGATGYQFWLGTGSVGSANLCSSGVLSSSVLSITCNNLPVAGQTLYARLYTELSGAWQHTDYTYTAATLSQGALSSPSPSPSPSSTLTGTSQLFQWSAGSGATGYQFWLGTGSVGSANLCSSGVLSSSSLSITCNNLPVAGQTLYARLYTELSGAWQHTDYTYTAITWPVLSSPSPTSQLAGPSVTFTWNPGGGATAYQLWLGSIAVNTNDLYSSGVTTGPSVTANNLPTNGETIYARLYFEINSVWYHADYTYTAGTAPAITSPTPASTLTGSSQQFQWSGGGGATAYQLWVGTTSVNSHDLYASGVTAGASATVNNIPTTGGTVYVRLYIEINGVWNHEDYTFTEYTTGP